MSDFQAYLLIDIFNTSNEMFFSEISQNLIDDKSVISVLDHTFDCHISE